jgi:hypothetical protein
MPNEMNAPQSYLAMNFTRVQIVREARDQTPKPSFHGGTSASDRFAFPMLSHWLPVNDQVPVALFFCSPIPINTLI